MSLRNPFALFRLLGRSLLPFPGPIGGPVAPPGFALLIGADGAPLLGADGAPLFGVA